MADGIYIALTGAISQQQALDSAAHNIANASTTGFRGDRLAFAEMLPAAQATSSTKSPQHPGSYVRVDQTALDTEAGLLKQTGNTLDLALAGDGYFVVRTPQGDRLTRAGAFRLDAQQRLSNAEGMLVVGEDGQPITLPQGATAVTISAEGIVQADGKNFSKLALRNVADPATLSREGSTTYKPNAGVALLPASDLRVMQGYLESSNVNVFESIEELGDINASFSALMRVIESFDQIDSRTARELGSRTG